MAAAPDAASFRRHVDRFAVPKRPASMVAGAGATLTTDRIGMPPAMLAARAIKAECVCQRARNRAAGGAGRTIPTLSLCIWPESPVTEGERALSRPNRSWNAPGNILDGVEVDQDRTGRGDIDDGPGARTQCYPLTDIGVSSPLGGL